MSPYKLDRLIEIIVDNLTGVDKCIEKIILYGPYSRKDFSAWADIELIILLKCEKAEYIDIRDKILDNLISIGLRYNETITPTIITKEAISDTIDHIFYGQHAESGLIVYSAQSKNTSSCGHTKLPVISKEHREYLKKYINSFDELLLGDVDELISAIDDAFLSVGLDDNNEPTPIRRAIEHIRDYVFYTHQ